MTRWWWLPWLIVPLLIAAVVIAALLPLWGITAFLAVCVVVVAPLLWRRYGRELQDIQLPSWLPGGRGYR